MTIWRHWRPPDRQIGDFLAQKSPKKNFVKFCTLFRPVNGQWGPLRVSKVVVVVQTFVIIEISSCCLHSKRFDNYMIVIMVITWHNFIMLFTFKTFWQLHDLIMIYGNYWHNFGNVCQINSLKLSWVVINSHENSYWRAIDLKSAFQSCWTKKKFKTAKNAISRN